MHFYSIYNNFSIKIIVEGETTTADNNSILPSKKRTTHIVNQPTNISKRKLSKKERKRLEKVLDLKKKKAKVRIYTSQLQNHSFFFQYIYIAS